MLAEALGGDYQELPDSSLYSEVKDRRRAFAVTSASTPAADLLDTETSATDL
jgi:hypothetical protein